MIAALLFAAAAPQTAVDAERAFAAAAQKDGQWTAFRRFAASDAIMFTPQPVKAQDWLKDRKDPPASVRWQPVLSVSSCDGKTAINTGSWRQPDGSVGYFTTVWRRQPSGDWRWVLDFGGVLPKAQHAPGAPTIIAASCGKPVANRPLPAGIAGGGASADGTLRWWYTLGANGRRTLAADYWDGGRFRPALANQEGPPPAK